MLSDSQAEEPEFESEHSHFLTRFSFAQRVIWSPTPVPTSSVPLHFWCLGLFFFVWPQQRQTFLRRIQQRSHKWCRFVPRLSAGGPPPHYWPVLRRFTFASRCEFTKMGQNTEFLRTARRERHPHEWASFCTLNASAPIAGPI